MQAAVAGIVAAVRRAVEGLDVTVTDGPPSGPAETRLAVSIGLGFNDEPPITLTDTPIGAGMRGDQELVVRCLALAQGPVDGDMTAVRGSLVDALARIATAIATDRTLGGSAGHAQMSGVQRFWPARTTEAVVVTASFDVTASILD